MVAQLVRLKLRLLGNSLRASTWKVVSLVLAALWGLGTSSLLVVGLIAARDLDVADARTVVVMGGAVLTVGWALLPILAFGSDETLDPLRFATFPLTRRDLVLGLTAAGLVGVPAVATSILALGTVGTWARGPLAVVVALLGAVLGVLTCIVVSRTVSTTFAALSRQRRTKDLVSIVAILVALSFGPLSQSLARIDGDILTAARPVTDVLAWTPLGLAWAAPADVADGRPLLALVRLALAVLVLVAVAAGWGVALDRATTQVTSGGSTRLSAERPLRGRWLPATPTGAVMARALRYWRRDPRYATALVAVFALPLLFVVGPLFAGQSVGGAFVLLGPLLGAVLGWTSHNDTSYDGTAWHLHVVTGLSGAADRMGRALAVIPAAVLIAVGGSVLGTGLAGRWELLPASAGAAVGLLLAGQAVSAVASGLTPYPVPAAGENPFGSAGGSAVTVMIAQFVTATLTVLVALPAVIGLALAAFWDPVAGWVTLVVAPGAGFVALLVGVRVGGRIVEDRAPELLNAIRPRR